MSDELPSGWWLTPSFSPPNFLRAVADPLQLPLEQGERKVSPVLGEI